MEREAFVAEGNLEIGPKDKYFIFLDGEFLGELLVKHFQASGEPGYCDLGRTRITVEQLEAE